MIKKSIQEEEHVYFRTRPLKYPHSVATCECSISMLKFCLILAWSLLLIKWNLVRLGDHAHGIVTKTVHKTLSGVSGGEGVVGYGSRGSRVRGKGSRSGKGLWVLWVWGVCEFKLFYAVRKCKMIAIGVKSYQNWYTYLYQSMRPWGPLIACRRSMSHSRYQQRLSLVM